MNRPKLNAHFIGGIPVDDAETAFRRLGEDMGSYIRYIPDGETGRRRRWISFVKDTLVANDSFEPDPNVPIFQFVQYDGAVIWEFNQLRLRDGVEPNRVVFNTGYADDAIRNFKIFDRLQSDGVIPRDVKYQICMGTPLAITYLFVAPVARDEFVVIYTKHLAEEIQRIMEELPNNRIAYQWDVCIEVLMWEGYLDQSPHPDYKTEIPASLCGLSGLIPNAVDLGYHLCYGSPGDEHMIQPKDAANMVEMANAISLGAAREINYIHMPVPHDRNDEAYFVPLKGLELQTATDLYLGCIHHGDHEGNTHKLEMASKYVDVTGVGAECGLSRGDPRLFDNILHQHRELVSGRY